MATCPVCCNPDAEACRKSREEFRELQETRRRILERHGIDSFQNPIGGLHKQWETRPVLGSLFAFLARLSDPHAIPPGVLDLPPGDPIKCPLCGCTNAPDSAECTDCSAFIPPVSEVSPSPSLPLSPSSP